MADDADRAQESYDNTMSADMETRRRKREEELRPENLPFCELCQDRRVFVTEKGTKARYCKPCWSDLRS